MPVIKRYPNRKMYDTAAKQYITLQGIAALIRRGEEVTVIDHATGKDLTALTLSQIIFEQEKRQRGFLPLSVLTGLIQAGGDTLGTLRRSLASPLGLLRQVDEEIERRVRALIRRGELEEKQGLCLLDQLLAQGRRSRRAFQPSEEDLERVLARRGVPTRKELQALMEQIDALTQELDELNHDRT